MRWFMLTLLMFIACGQPEEAQEINVRKIATGLKFAEGPAWSNKGILYENIREGHQEI